MFFVEPIQPSNRAPECAAASDDEGSFTIRRVTKPEPISRSAGTTGERLHPRACAGPEAGRVVVEQESHHP